MRKETQIKAGGMSQALTLYAAGAALLASGRLLPTVIEWGAWGAFEAGRSVHWMVWGRPAEDERLMRVVREAVRAELQAQRNGTAPLPLNTPIRRNIEPAGPYGRDP